MNQSFISFKISAYRYWDACRKDNTIDSLYKYATESGMFGGALIGVCVEDTNKSEVAYAIGVEYNGADITDELNKSFPDRRTIENSDLCANSPKKL